MVPIQNALFFGYMLFYILKMTHDNNFGCYIGVLGVSITYMIIYWVLIAVTWHYCPNVYIFWHISGIRVMFLQADPIGEWCRCSKWCFGHFLDFFLCHFMAFGPFCWLFDACILKFKGPGPQLVYNEDIFMIFLIMFCNFLGHFFTFWPFWPLDWSNFRWWNLLSFNMLLIISKNYGFIEYYAVRDEKEN